MNKIVVADAGPLIALVRIERLSLLFALYGSVVLAPGRGDGSKGRMTLFARRGSGSTT
jgi:predicted nucleic acid-binding protein